MTIMETIRNKPYMVNQIFVISGLLSTILSCGLGLGFIAVIRQQKDDSYGDPLCERSLRFIEVAGELAFVPSIFVIPYAMQRNGRRYASILTTVLLLFSWVISLDTHFTSLVIFNILHHLALGGAVTISSIIISEYCTPRYRGMFLMLETAMISLGVLLSHVSGILYSTAIICTLGILNSLYSLIVVYFSPESPYWLLSQGHMVRCTESFEWLRGQDEEAFKELESMLKVHKLQIQLETLRPISRIDIKVKCLNYAKSLLKADFLRPLSIMILLFSFISFGGENVVTSYTLRDIFKLTNGKYIGTIILDVLTLVCSLTACVLVQIVRRKTLLMFTGLFSVVFLALTSLLLFLQSIEMFSKDYTWLFLSFVTGYVMFMSLGTTALPFSVLGEIFPMSYKGIGSSLTCAYLWAFGNSILRLLPSLVDYIGVHGMLLVTLISMVVILILLSKIMPETNAKSLIEIEMMIKSKHRADDDYETVNVNDQDDTEHFDRLRLFIDIL